jgi:hypothetical protein
MRCFRRYCLILRRRRGRTANRTCSQDLETCEDEHTAATKLPGATWARPRHAAPVEVPESLAWEGLASTAHLSLRDLHPGLLTLRT